MQLTVWTYEGPPHIGAIRIATSLRDVHCVLHAPLGDSYADLLFTMIARDAQRPAVTYTSFQARDLGADTAELVRRTVLDVQARFQPKALLVAESCTAELLQNQAGALAQGLDLSVPVIPLELSAYSKKENWGASETFYRLVRGLLLAKQPAPLTERPPRPADRRPRVNLLGPTALGFRCRDDVVEVERLLAKLGVDVHVTAPAGAGVTDLLTLAEADANVCLYPEIAQSTCSWLEKHFKQPTIRTVPLGIGATRDFVRELADVLGLTVDEPALFADATVRLPWYSRSVDSTYLTGKRVFIFGDGTHALAAARIAREEMGFDVVGLGTYSRELAREVRAAATELGLDALITDDYLEVEAKVSEAQPELVLGTQMERHVAKRLGVPCAVISAPAHVQDFPARYAPQMGLEGANVIFDTWVHPLMMGLEEHLLTMFRGDFEFHDEAAPSHLGSAKQTQTHQATKSTATTTPAACTAEELEWLPEAEQELRKIPFFVRGKARRNTERYALERKVTKITVETLYDAKAHFGR